MAFEIPQDLHPDLVPLAWLLGRWEGRGHGDYPTIEKFEFGQQIDFSHNGKPYLHYVSQTYVVGEDGTKERPLAVETGFWRPKPDNKVEVILAHPTGIAEIWYGEIDGAKIELQNRRRRPHRDRQGGHRRPPPVRPGQRRAPVGLRHGRRGPGPPAPPLGNPRPHLIRYVRRSVRHTPQFFGR